MAILIFDIFRSNSLWEDGQQHTSRSIFRLLLLEKQLNCSNKSNDSFIRYFSLQKTCVFLPDISQWPYNDEVDLLIN